MLYALLIGTLDAAWRGPLHLALGLFVVTVFLLPAPRRPTKLQS